MRHQIREKTHIKIILITSSYICIQVFCLSCSLSVCLSLLAVFPPNFLNFIYNVHKYMRITPCKRIQDSLGFWIPRLGFRIPGTGFWNLCQWNLDSGFQWLVGFRIPWTVFWIRKPRIADSTGKNSLDYGFHDKHFPWSAYQRWFFWNLEDGERAFLLYFFPSSSLLTFVFSLKCA